MRWMSLSMNQSTFSIKHWVAGWVAGLLGQTTRWPSVWCSKYYFLFIIFCKILCKNLFNLFFYNFTKIKSFECPKSIRSNEKKIVLRAWDAWLMSRLVYRPSNPAYHIEDCRISGILVWPRSEVGDQSWSRFAIELLLLKGANFCWSRKVFKAKSLEQTHIHICSLMKSELP